MNEESEGVIALEIEGKAKRKLRVGIELEVPTQRAVTVALAAGDPWLEGVTGPVVGNSISGDISAHSVSGLLTFSSASGDVAISSYRGALSVTSQSGEIEVEEGQGPIEAKSVSRDLTVEIEQIGDGAIKLTSVSGDVGVLVPSHIGYTVALSTLSGDVENDLELADKERTSRSLKGRRGNGDIPVSVTTVSGDIEIREK